MNAELKGINCTTCGAALPALAGHKAKSLICSYCGSVMDRHDDYKVLAQYRDMPRPDGPFTIGDEGDVMGVRQTVVGIVGVQSRIEGEMYYWTNYQLYSPTHGYSWMTWNDGHLTHSRKVRDGGSFEHIGFITKEPFSAQGRDFKMFEKYTAAIHYIEGELTWIPKLNDTVGVIDGIDPPYGFSIAATDGEIETELQTYLDRREVIESFGFSDDLPRPGGVHAIQPFNEGSVHGSMAAAAKYFLPVCAALGFLTLIFGGGSKIAEATFNDPAKGGELSFEASTGGLMSIEMASNLSNSWAWYDMTLVHDESGEEIEFGNGLEYYSGYEGGERWTEGSQTATLNFKPPKDGKYTLRVAEAKDSKGRQPLRVEVRKNVFVARYFIALAIIFGVIMAAMWFRRSSFESARWGGGDDDD